MTRLIDAVDLAERVSATFYDQEHEEWTQQTVTVADVLDSVCDDYTILPYEQPTIDAVPVRHGKFIGTEYDGYADGSPVYYEWKCSVCGCIFEDDEPTYNYCPNCGARMDAE